MDYSGRLFVQGKASISAEVAGIFERWDGVRGLAEPVGKAPRGSVAGPSCTSFAKLLEIGERPGVRHLVSLTGCPIL